MTDDNANTADLTDSEKLDAIIRRLDAIEAQRDTRPLLDQILKEMTETRDAMNARLDAVEKQLRSIDRKFDVFNKEMLAMKADVRDFDERLSELERRPN